MRSQLTLIIILFSLATHAQAPKEKWGNATQEELTMAYCAIDPSADAAILNNYGHYYFNRHYYFSAQELRTIYHYQVRLKVFTEEGKKYATISIPFRGYDQYEDVVEITGITYNLVDGKVVKSKMKAKTIQWTRNGRDTWNCTFTLPDVKPGSVIEYSYKIASLDFVQLRNWLFQGSIPVLNSNLVLTTPNFFQYAFFSNVPSYQLEVKKTDENTYIQFYNLNIYTYGTNLQLIARNIPAFKSEPLMPDSNRLVLKGEFLLASAITRPSEFSNIRDYYLMPYLKPLLLTTTEDYYQPRERIGLYSEIIGGYKIIEGMDWESFVKKLSKKGEFGKNMLKAFENKWLIDSFRKVETGQKRMIAIYDYVKHYMKWNGEYRIFGSNSLEKIFEMKTGYSSDINMLLINLLNRSGIQARPVLISTRSYGDVYKEMGFFRKFNHVIVSVELEGKRYLLDAIDPHRPYDLLSVDDLNGEGLLINLLNYEWIPLGNHSLSELKQTEKYNITPEGNYKAEITSSFSGYLALQKRQELLNSSSDLEKTNVENLQSEESPLIINNTDQGTLTNVQADSISFLPLSLHSLIENPFVAEQRTYPVDLKFERNLTRDMSIQIPEKYTLVSYPQERSFIMQGGFVSCSLKSVVEQTILKLQFRIEVNNSYIPPQFYPDLLLFFEAVKKLEQESVVFRKIQ